MGGVDRERTQGVAEELEGHPEKGGRPQAEIFLPEETEFLECDSRHCTAFQTLQSTCRASRNSPRRVALPLALQVLSFSWILTALFFPNNQSTRLLFLLVGGEGLRTGERGPGHSPLTREFNLGELSKLVASLSERARQ